MLLVSFFIHRSLRRIDINSRSRDRPCLVCTYSDIRTPCTRRLIEQYNGIVRAFNRPAGIIISSCFSVQIDTDTKYREDEKEAWVFPLNEKVVMTRRERRKEMREKEGLRYTLQVRARLSRAANEPAAACFWLHSPRY